MDGGKISSATTSQAATLVLSDAQFQNIAGIAHREFGLSLPQNKKPLVHSRLSKRVRALGLDDFDTYITSCVGPAAVEGELTNLLSALTTNVTHFFRERHHFELLTNEILPPLIERARAGGRVRLWSAGCSSGQEAYSIAMTLLDSCPDAAKLNIKILATDIDPEILKLAKAAVYPDDAISDEDRGLRNKYFDTATAGKISVKANVRQLVSFGQINLIANWPIKGPFDVVFCRNVAIYFDKDTQANVLSNFCRVMAPEGYLMIGHSERLSGPSASELQSVGVTAYRKKSQFSTPTMQTSGQLSPATSKPGTGG